MLCKNCLALRCHLKFRIEALLAACKPLILLDFHRSFNDTQTMSPWTAFSSRRLFSSPSIHSVTAPFRKKSRSRLFACQRAHSDSLSLPTFCDCALRRGIPVSSVVYIRASIGTPVFLCSPICIHFSAK